MPVFDADAWRRTALAVAAFKHAHGHWPRASKNAEADERRLGQWLARTRNAFNSGRTGHITTDENRAFLDLNVPDWNGTADTDRDQQRHERWQHAAELLAEFRSTHGRWPRDSADDEDERRLGTWLVNTRHAARKDQPWLTADRRTWLDTHAAGWQGETRSAHRPRADDKWRANLDAVIAFHAKHDRLPSRSTDAADPEASRLARWLTNHRSAERRGQVWFTAERRNLLDEALPQWRE